MDGLPFASRETTFRLSLTSEFHYFTLVYQIHRTTAKPGYPRFPVVHSSISLAQHVIPGVLAKRLKSTGNRVKMMQFDISSNRQFPKQIN
jgi:hypothetical protein